MEDPLPQDQHGGSQREPSLQRLREMVKEGVDSLEKHGALDGDQVFAELRRKAARMRESMG